MKLLGNFSLSFDVKNNHIVKLFFIILIPLFLFFSINQTFAQKKQEFTLTGFAYEDTNKNGVYDVGDIPLKNANLTIQKSGFVFPANTDASGNFIYKTDLPGEITLSYIGNIFDKEKIYSKTVLIQKDIPNVRVNFGINPLTNAALFQSANPCDSRCNNEAKDICYNNKSWGRCEWDDTFQCYFIKSTVGDCPTGYCNQNTNRCEEMAQNCGDINQTCCGGFTCKSTFSKCSSVSYGGYVCLSCGGYGEPVCINNACKSGYTFTNNGYCCLSGQTYNGSQCVQSCGGENQSCCVNGSQYTCNTSDLKCDYGVYGNSTICTKCGGAGQVTCSWGCSADNTTTNSHCCPTGQVWINNSCQAPPPPTVTLSKPLNNSTAKPGDSVIIESLVTPCTSTDSVEFQIDSGSGFQFGGYLTKQAFGNTCIYANFWNALQGQYKIKVIAYDNSIKQGESSVNTITVCPTDKPWNGTQCGSTSGTINISDPKNGATAKSGDPILISATLSSCDGVDLVTYSTKTNLTQTGNLIKFSGCTYTATWTATEGLNPITATAYANNQKLVNYTSNVVNVFVCPAGKNWDQTSQTCVTCTGSSCNTACSQRTTQSSCESPDFPASSCYWANNTCQSKLAAGGSCSSDIVRNICASPFFCGLDGKCGDCSAGKSCCRTNDPNAPTCISTTVGVTLTCNKTTKLCEVASGEGQVCGANNTCPANLTCTGGHCCAAGKTWDATSSSCKTVSNDVIITFIRPTNGQVLTEDFKNGLVNLDGKGVPLANLRFCYDSTSGLCFDYPKNQYAGKTTAQVTFEWILTDISNGPHKLLAIATTTQNKTGQGEVSVTINKSGRQPTNTPAPTSLQNTPVPTSPPGNTPVPTSPPGNTPVPTANPTATGTQPTATGVQPTSTTTVTPPAPTLTAIALTPTITSSQLTPTITATQPTLTAIALTPTATGVQPTSTPKPTNIPTLQPISLNVEVRLPGIGTVTGDNNNPKRKKRNIEVTVSSTQNKDPKSFTGYVIFDPNEYYFTAIDTPIQITGISEGSYTVKVRLDNTLFKQLTSIKSLEPGSSVGHSEVTLISGDLNADNVLNVADYNIFRGCYGNKICSKKDISDLNEDSVVEEKDLNILLRGMILTTNGE